MRRSLLCVVALLTLGTAGAAAEEMPTAPAYFLQGPTLTRPWTGFYVGANGGYAWSHSAVRYSPNDPASLAGTCGGVGKGTCINSISFNRDGPLAGGQIGWNWQLNANWLLGIEADYQWSDQTGTGSSPFHLGNVGGSGNTSTMVVNQTVNSFGTVRLRMGVIPMAPLLLYGTGGLAFGQVRQNFTMASASSGSVSSGGFSYLCTAGGGNCFAGSSTNTNVGYTVGGGAEYAITNNLTLKSELLYVDLGARSTNIAAQTVAATAPASFTGSTSSVNFIVARGGMNLRF